MRLRIALLVACVTLGTVTAPSVLAAPDGSPYWYDLMPVAWPKTQVTVCPYTGSAFKTASFGWLYPVDSWWHPFVEAAADNWTAGNGHPMTVHYAAQCTRATDIRIYQWNGPSNVAGRGACAFGVRNRDHYPKSAQYDCYPGSGLILLNQTVQFNDVKAARTVAHEIGHNIGLDHPTSNGCDNACYGPLMSYGSCRVAKVSKCIYYPTSHDAVGLRVMYTGSEQPQMGQCMPMSDGGALSRASSAIASPETDPVMRALIEAVPDDAAMEAAPGRVILRSRIDGDTLVWDFRDALDMPLPSVQDYLNGGDAAEVITHVTGEIGRTNPTGTAAGTAGKATSDARHALAAAGIGAECS